MIIQVVNIERPGFIPSLFCFSVKKKKTLNKLGNGEAKERRLQTQKGEKERADFQMVRYRHNKPTKSNNQ